MTTDRQSRVLEKLKLAGTATTTELVEWCECERRDAVLCLGIMIRVKQIFRVGWRDHDGVKNGIAIWSTNPNLGKFSEYDRDLRQAMQPQL